MRLIINSSSLTATGAVQVTISFIRECINFPENTYCIFLSEVIGNQIDIKDFPKNFIFHIFRHKPFITPDGLKMRRRMAQIEKDFKPDCVFTVFGPSYWTPKNPHLMGYAYPYYIYTESPMFDIISIGEKIRIKINSVLHKYYFRKNGKYFVCETDDVRNRAQAYLNCDSEDIFTVTNTANIFFNENSLKVKRFMPEKKQKEFRFITMSSGARHKNLEILNEVIPRLKSKTMQYEIKFILTLNAVELKSKFSPTVLSDIYNIGRVKAEDCHSVYLEADALFLPTLMECFSASYPEAMKMKKPIITSDLPFAHTVCNDAALYFHPLNAEDIVEKIQLLVETKSLQDELILKGTEQLKEFDTSYTKALKYLNLCREISKRKDISPGN